MARYSLGQTDTLFPIDHGVDVTDAITITGSRQIGECAIDGIFGEALSLHLGHSRTWLIGGAMGIDQLATEWLIDRGEKVIAVLPFTAQDQPGAVQDTLARVDRRIELRYQKSKNSFLQRNAFMVRHSATVIAFWNGEKGGTWATLQLGLKLRKRVHVYPI